jgi:hypothetical protein
VALRVLTKRKAASQFVPFLLSPVPVAYPLTAVVKAARVSAVGVLVRSASAILPHKAPVQR